MAAEIHTFLIVRIRDRDDGDGVPSALAVTFAPTVRGGISASGGTLVELTAAEALAAFPSTRQALRCAVDLQMRLAADNGEKNIGIGVDAGEAVRVAGGYRGRALNLASRLSNVAGPGEVLASQDAIHLAGEVLGLTFGEPRELALKGFDELVRAVAVTAGGEARGADPLSHTVWVQLLGGFRVALDAHVVGDAEWRLKKSAALVKMLAVAPNGRLHREQVLDVLWPDLDPAAALNNLNHALHVGRRTVDPGGAIAGLLRLHGGLIVLCPPDMLKTDVEAFESAASTARHTGLPADYRKALELYTGELLPGDGDEEWLRPRREALRVLYEGLQFELRHADKGGAAHAPVPEIPHNLPASLASFVGREGERRRILDLLHVTRLLTLTGAGGAGKTRLALEIAPQVLPRYPNGVWFVELAAVTGGSLVPQAVARAVNVREQPGRPLANTLVESLQSRTLLLILDNCEHLVDACAELVEYLLLGCPGVHILATSREPLDLGAEVVFQVPPLSIPPIDNPQAAADSEAVQLFVQRVRARQPDFALTAENEQLVGAIVRRLDGIPLAVELAAARVGVLSLEQVNTRLEDALGLLTSRKRTAAPHQQTIRGTLDWSYDLLDESEATLFTRLSVFAGGWMLDAAETVGVGTGLGPSEVLDVLSRLVDKSLVLAESTDSGDVRYRLLEPVRQYAYERLAESGLADAVRESHAVLFSDLAAKAEPALKGRAQLEWLTLLEREGDNLRAALAWLTSHGAAERAAFMGWDLWHHWVIRGYVFEAERWMKRTLATGATLSQRGRGRALHMLAGMLFTRGQLERARPLEDEAVELMRAAGEPRELAFVLVGRGYIALAGGDIVMGTACLEESLAVYRDIGDRWGIAGLLGAYGRMSMATGDLDRAVEQLDECLSILRQIGNIWERSWNLHVLGTVRLLQGDYVRATAALEEALRISQLVNDRYALGNCLDSMAAVAALQGQAGRAARLFGATEALRAMTGVAAMTPAETELHDRAVETARCQVGELDWQRGVDEGHAMPLTDVITYALSVPTSATSPSLGSQEITRARGAESTGGSILSPREREVADLIVEGLTNRQIAGKLIIAERTVDTHVGKILSKLEVSSRAQVATWVIEQRSQSRA